MASPTKLFLEHNDIDGRVKVIDKDGFCFGDGETSKEAIASARIVTNAPIYFGSGVSVSNDTDVYETNELIQELSNLAGFKVRQAYDKDMTIIGWTMELVE